MNRAPLACAAVGFFVGTLALTACSSSAVNSKPSAPSCASQVAAWEGTGVGADFSQLPGQLKKTSTDVQQEQAASLGGGDTSAAKADLATLLDEYKLLSAHQPPSCVPNLRADYANFLRFYNEIVNQELPAFIANPADIINGDLAWGHATYEVGELATVLKDLKGHTS